MIHCGHQVPTLMRNSQIDAITVPPDSTSMLHCTNLKSAVSFIAATLLRMLAWELGIYTTTQ